MGRDAPWRRAGGDCAPLPLRRTLSRENPSWSFRVGDGARAPARGAQSRARAGTGCAGPKRSRAPRRCPLASQRVSRLFGPSRPAFPRLLRPRRPGPVRGLWWPGYGAGHSATPSGTYCVLGRAGPAAVPELECRVARRTLTERQRQGGVEGGPPAGLASVRVAEAWALKDGAICWLQTCAPGRGNEVTVASAFWGSGLGETDGRRRGPRPAQRPAESAWPRQVQGTLLPSAV